VGRGVREEAETGQAPTEMAVNEPQLSVADIESGLEDLADEIGRLIEDAPSEEREALHDYAVSLVREKLPAVEQRPAMLTANSDETPTNSVSLIGYGFLLLPVAFLMLMVFAPLGAVLMVTGIVLVVAGAFGSMVARSRRP
jgi:hypothetical protein